MTIRLSRRAFVATVAGGLSLALAGSIGAARAQDVAGWPKGQTIRLVVPFPAGGATDVIGRIMSDKLAQIWGQPVVVENKGGAGGNIGADQVARSTPDGTMFLIHSVGMAANPFLYKKLNHDPVKDFAPVSLVAMVPNILITGKDKPWKSVTELIAFGRANPGKLSYASSGVGTSVHLSGELFRKLTGVEIVHVPYRGSAPAIQDVMGGRVDIMFDNITSALPQVRAGTLKALGITTATRSPFARELDPIAPVVPGFDVSSWFAFFLPAQTPKPVIAKFAADTQLALKDPAVIEKLGALAAEPVGSTPDELARFLAAETDKWGKLIKEAGISIN